MGCCSSDVVPEPPEVIKPDPGVDPVVVQVAALGMWGGSRDFGVWEGKRPTDNGDANKSVWLWFNKMDVAAGQVRIDLENFHRGHIPDQPKKGRVLYYAVMAEKPMFQSFMRMANGARDSFYGIYDNNTYQEQDDNFYINHPTHRNKLRVERRTLGHIVSKWSMNAKCNFFDGELGRGAASFQGQPVVMEVFSKGTVVTSYQTWQEQVEIRDAEGNVTGTRMETRYDKDTTELVDRIEYRLTFNGMLWCQWYCEGNASHAGGVDPSIESPLFTTVIGGGWFTRSYFNITTKPGVDPALAMLISHVCGTEYSVAQVKADLVIHTPDRYPQTFNNGYVGNGVHGMQLRRPPAQHKGNFTFNMNIKVH